MSKIVGPNAVRTEKWVYAKKLIKDGWICEKEKLWNGKRNKHYYVYHLWRDKE